MIDVCLGSDDKLIDEDELTKAWKLPQGTSKQKAFGSTWFDEDGRMTGNGLDSLPLEWKDKATRIGCFKQSRYVKRYALLEQVIRSTEPHCKIVHSTLAIGVAGWIPSFTHERLKLIEPEAKTSFLCQELRKTAWKFAILAYKAWKTEC